MHVRGESTVISHFQCLTDVNLRRKALGSNYLLPVGSWNESARAIESSQLTCPVDLTVHFLSTLCCSSHELRGANDSGRAQNVPVLDVGSC